MQDKPEWVEQRRSPYPYYFREVPEDEDCKMLPWQTRAIMHDELEKEARLQVRWKCLQNNHTPSHQRKDIHRHMIIMVAEKLEAANQIQDERKEARAEDESKTFERHQPEFNKSDPEGGYQLVQCRCTDVARRPDSLE